MWGSPDLTFLRRGLWELEVEADLSAGRPRYSPQAPSEESQIWGTPHYQWDPLCAISAPTLLMWENVKGKVDYFDLPALRMEGGEK